MREGETDGTFLFRAEQSGSAERASRVACETQQSTRSCISIVVVVAVLVLLVVRGVLLQHRLVLRVDRRLELVDEIAGGAALRDDAVGRAHRLQLAHGHAVQVGGQRRRADAGGAARAAAAAAGLAVGEQLALVGLAGHAGEPLLVGALGAQAALLALLLHLRQRQG
eukprot:scaffold36844_cov58-Phaeocystis_antarctica.AAC.8